MDKIHPDSRMTMNLDFFFDQSPPGLKGVVSDMIMGRADADYYGLEKAYTVRLSPTLSCFVEGVCKKNKLSKNTLLTHLISLGIQSAVEHLDESERKHLIDYFVNVGVEVKHIFEKGTFKEP